MDGQSVIRGEQGNTRTSLIEEPYPNRLVGSLPAVGMHDRLKQVRPAVYLLPRLDRGIVPPVSGLAGCAIRV